MTPDKQKFNNLTVFDCENGVKGTLAELYADGWRLIQTESGMAEGKGSDIKAIRSIIIERDGSGSRTSKPAK
jgi:hypothetical protein